MEYRRRSGSFGLVDALSLTTAGIALVVSAFAMSRAENMRGVHEKMAALNSRMDYIVAKQNEGPGLGVKRSAFMDSISQKFACEFKETTNPRVAAEQFATVINGVNLIVRGPEKDVHSVTLLGALEGDFGKETIDVFERVVETIVPEWTGRERITWLGRVAQLGTTDVDFYAVVNGIRVNMANEPFAEDVTMRVVSFERAP